MTFIDDIAEFSLSEKNDLPKDLEIWMNRYIENKKAEKKKKKTIKSYENAISPFIEFCEVHKKSMKIDMITARFINRYLMWYQEQLAASALAKDKIKKNILDTIKKEQNEKTLGRNDALFTVFEEFENTLSHRLNVLKDLLKYISENNNNEHDFSKLFDMFARIKISEKMTDHLTVRELEKVVTEMINWPDTYKSSNRKPKSSLRLAYRDSFLILLYCLTGARSEEIVLLKLKDFSEDGDRYIIKIEHGKGGSKRTLSVLKKLIQSHFEYLEGELESEESYLSAPYDVKNKCYKDKPMSPNTIRTFENFILKLLNINKSGLHAVRRGYATKRIATDGKDISIVAKELGNTVAILEKHYFKHTPELDK